MTFLPFDNWYRFSFLLMIIHVDPIARVGLLRGHSMDPVRVSTGLAA